MIGDEGRLVDDDVLAARASKARDEPGVVDPVVAAWHQKEAGTMLRGERSQDRPRPRVAAAREVPPTGQQIAAGRLLGLARRVETGGREHVGRGAVVLLLRPFGIHSEQPVVAGPDGEAPRRRATPAAEHGAHLDHRVVVETVATVTRGVGDPEQPDAHEILDRLVRNASLLLRHQGAFRQHGHQGGSALEELVTADRCAGHRAHRNRSHLGADVSPPDPSLSRTMWSALTRPAS